jgi:phage-related protein
MYVTKILQGQSFDLYALVINHECQVYEYISKLDDKDLKQVFSLFNFICEKGPPTNKEKFKHICDQIYELKTGAGIRVLSFFGGPQLRKALVLTHGFPKPQKRTLKREKKKAVEWRKEFSEIDDIKKRIEEMEKKP